MNILQQLGSCCRISTAIVTIFVGHQAAVAQSQAPTETEHDFSRSELIHMFVIEPEIKAGIQRAPTRLFRFPHNADGGRSYGIDVSHHNRDIDWKKVANNNKVMYAYIKATQGTGFKDRRFARNIKNARNNGISAGAYHFLSSSSSGAAQADHFIATYRALKQAKDLSPVLDLEWDATSSGKDRWADKTPKQIVDSALAWLKKVEAELNVRPIIYTNKAWWDGRVASAGSRLNGYELWMARYGGYDKPAPKLPSGFKWRFWQFTDRGRVAGINGRVDVNVAAPNIDVTGPTPPAVTCSHPDKPEGSEKLTNQELAQVFDHIRNTFGSLSPEAVTFLNAAINTADTRVLRRIINGDIARTLDRREQDEYFAVARDKLELQRYNQSQVDLLNIILLTSDPDVIRACSLR